ncbi:type II toxin-antitoxin system HicB family antitoxin [Caryophanon latum]|uniref:Pilus assembly protein HicB n=1 Tax=Caryophanon latum TaxID=33977 RepID=A0A1C0Z179_9BACL|nr:type II toxin-antitoxin system HicB family antitoxin [Caryophanon latum]OCS93207.1 hypothetical protein A6K76_05725 [Caryophanon latum]
MSTKLPNIYNYLAVLSFLDDGQIHVRIPDFPNVFIQEKKEENVLYKDAEQALALHIFTLESLNEPLPVPTSLKDLSLEENEVPILLRINMAIARSKIKQASVKKTLTIPKWLNDAAEQENINFSLVLQNALKEQLHPDDPSSYN